MIRLATEGDISTIEVLIKSEAGFWNDSWRADVIARGIANSDGLSFVYLDDTSGTIVGFICAHDTGFRAYLSELIVSEQERCKGIARKLLDKVEQELKSRGCSLIIADVWKSAEQFYKSQNWCVPDVTLLVKDLT